MTDVATAPDVADVDALIADMGRRARAAATILAATPTATKAMALARAAAAIRADEAAILEANARDMAAGWRAFARGLDGLLTPLTGEPS